MLTLYHSPNSRSTRIITLLTALDVMDQIDIRLTDIPRQDGSGGRDPNNPHPEGKVPFLVTEDGETIRETNAIMLYLCDRFPSDFAPKVGAPGRATMLSWMAWYGNVLEPVFVLNVAEISHPVLTSTFRGLPEAITALAAGLEGRDYLLGARYSVVDLLVASPFLWFPQALPDVPVIKDWVARCGAQPAIAQTAAYEAEAQKSLTEMA
ncbi:MULTISPECIES: glutathione S-transferase family protein [Roseobacteraceae]|uniref:Glutathione S-transferase n=1 Tax=Celeribacter baekdonensis B30 TaxID=1208323 RepID=K2JQT3_9RHOB|nr:MULTISPECIES: glutathione S-transferase family protein [Roseobacteraceae]EKE72809.1 glutathione S-transferase [Celeribacter baekdonensis B30]KAB6717936.1 glutathione S-transferase family protein [Roseobacter sp. TSBP12]|tara:strand:- start:13580 stop:14203 length:624 start_codon:yes stop_codon:yes gene_type:complete